MEGLLTSSDHVLGRHHLRTACDEFTGNHNTFARSHSRWVAWVGREQAKSLPDDTV
jgi:hypothetical protein